MANKAEKQTLIKKLYGIEALLRGLATVEPPKAAALGKGTKEAISIAAESLLTVTDELSRLTELEKEEPESHAAPPLTLKDGAGIKALLQTIPADLTD